MRAVIMAGGSGTRGRPYPDYFPKSMSPLLGRPMVEVIARHVCASRAIDGLVVIADLEGQGAQVRNHLEGARLGRPVSFVQGADGGTAGDLLGARREIGAGPFLLWFSDNLCALDIGAMARHHKKSRRAACVAVRSRRREQTGFAVVRDGLVEEFREKPTVSLPVPECLGIYVLDSAVLRDVRARASESGRVDLSYDILQPMASEGRVSAYDIGGAEWLDVESPVILDRNAGVAARIAAGMGAQPLRRGSRRGQSRQNAPGATGP